MMKPNYFLLLLLFLTLAAPAFSQHADAEFDRLLQETFKPGRPGVAVQIVQNGKVLYRKALGMANLELDIPMTPDHVFRIGSVSKQFTAAAILQLMEQGKLSLQDEITKFIPDYPTQGKKITVEHLLTHTSGIKSYTGMAEWTPEVHRKDFTPTALVDFFKNQPMDFEPGTQYKYNNSGYVLLGYIIEKVSGQSYAAYINDHIFKPLGMNQSYYGDTQPVIKNRASGYSQADAPGTYANAAFLSMTQPYAAGSLLSTVADLCTWTKALHSGKVIKPESLKKATTPYILPDGTNSRYGYGLQMGNLLGSPTVEHGGGIHGFLSDLVYLPKEDLCVAILTNCDCEPPRDLTAKLAALAIGKPFAPTAIQVDAGALEQYVGVYENDKKEQRVISVENGQLYSQRTGGSKFKIMPYAADQFFFENSFARIEFVREKSGGKKVVQAVVSDRTATDLLWTKTDKKQADARTELKLAEADLDKFLGEYELAPGFNIAVTREGAQLFCQATGQQRFEVFAESPTRFFLKVVDAKIEFYPDDKGMVPKMVLFQGGQEMPGKRVK
ncbi:MAG: serine hydrolase [Lewinellaceae bacterium]|nr:serine hydrolase [Lewinellaceae bacterium]